MALHILGTDVMWVQSPLAALQTMDLTGLQLIAGLLVMVLVAPFVLGGIDAARDDGKEEWPSDLDG